MLELLSEKIKQIGPEILLSEISIIFLLFEVSN